MTDAVSFIESAMLVAIQAETARILSEESDAAAARVRERLALIAPQLAMSIFKEFDVSRNHDRVMISVRNDMASASGA